MIRRCVLVRSAEPERVDRVLAAFERLHGKVPGLLRIVTAVDRGDRSRGYDRMFTLLFRDEEAIRVWSGHPAHVPIREELARCAELIVFEYDTPGGESS